MGSATITNTATGAFTYTPLAGKSGTDTFTFKAIDGTGTGHGDSNTATVTVTINGQPVASPFNDTVLEGQTLSGQLAAIDPENGPLTFAAAGNPRNVVVKPNGSFTFSPPQGSASVTPFTFRFTATDSSGFASAPATASITVTPSNRPPTVTAGQALTADAGTSKSGKATATDIDVPADTLTFAFTSTSAKGGTVAGNPDGTFAYTGKVGSDTTDTIIFTVTDGKSTPVTGSIAVTLNQPPVSTFKLQLGSTPTILKANSAKTLLLNPTINAGGIDVSNASLVVHSKDGPADILTIKSSGSVKVLKKNSGGVTTFTLTTVSGKTKTTIGSATARQTGGDLVINFTVGTADNIINVLKGIQIKSAKLASGAVQLQRTIDFNLQPKTGPNSDPKFDVVLTKTGK